MYTISRDKLKINQFVISHFTRYGLLAIRLIDLKKYALIIRQIERNRKREMQGIHSAMDNCSLSVHCLERHQLIQKIKMNIPHRRE